MSNNRQQMLQLADIAASESTAAAVSPVLADAIHMTNDIAMRDTSDASIGASQQLNMETSDDEDEDSISDSSSNAGDHVIPQGLAVASLPTGLCYDERMRYHSEVSAPTADSVHPEDPRRIYYIYKELCEAGLVAQGDIKPLIDPPLKMIPAREATEEEICLVHTKRHFDFVKSTADMPDEALIDLSENPIMDSIYFNSLSFYSGLLSAGGTIETCLAVASRQVKNAIAVVRPPGHHAEVECTMGFCLFNNTCIASRVCQARLGEKCRKILILDWDVHHGNGCQKAFYSDPNILYISIHVHMNGGFYPSGPDGDMYHCGEGLGVGKNVNIPWKTKGMGDGDYMFAFQHIVMPIATEFDPDFVIVSAGFDAAAGDELGGCFVSPACYAHMTHMLMSLANGKVAVCLEGGYNFTAISRSALAVTRTLMGEPPDRLDATQATQSGIQVVLDVKQIQSKYWKSIYPKDPIYGINEGERLHDIIREWQAMHLYDKYRLQELHIFRDNVSRSFQKQVLASPNYESKNHLIVFFHDPPDLMSPQRVASIGQKPHETWMHDASQSYIHTAITENFGIIDINIPEHITLSTNPPTSATNPHLNPSIFASQTFAFTDPTNDLARREAERLTTYIWENYVEPYDFRTIFLIGSGNAFHGVAKLISDNESLYESLAGVVAFICENPVRVVNNANNPWLSTWYRENSRVYVASDHQLWNKEKVSKRYGKLYRAPADVRGLNGMMTHYHHDAWEFIVGKAREADRIAGEEEDDSDEEDGDEDVRKKKQKKKKKKEEDGDGADADDELGANGGRRKQRDRESDHASLRNNNRDGDGDGEVNAGGDGRSKLANAVDDITKVARQNGVTGLGVVVAIDNGSGSGDVTMS